MFVIINKDVVSEDKHRCECKELVGKGICDKGFIWNPSICECDKSCDIRHKTIFRLQKLQM